MAKNGVAVGIDLGTTYSCVGVWQHDRVEIIGDAAMNQSALNPVNTIFDAKRLIGRRFSDSTVQSDMKHWPFKVVDDFNDRPKIVVNYKGVQKLLSPEELSSMVLIKMKDIAEDNIEVLATAGNTHLGGEDFDNRLLYHFVEEFKRKHKKDIRRGAKSLRRLKNACEKAKRFLSYNNKTSIDVDALFRGIDYSAKITRARFEDLNMDLFISCVETVKKCLEDADMDKSRVDDVVLVGGSTRIPKVQQLLQQFFDGMELCKNINPDEAVAYGAAVQAAILCGEGNQMIKNLMLLDVTPLSLGIHVEGGAMSVIIRRNTTNPNSKQDQFFTVKDDQTSVTIIVFEGERTRTADNNLLGHFELSGLPPDPRGKVQICVKFTIDADGVLSVSAENKTTGIKKSVKIIKRGTLTEEEIERIVKDAEKFKTEDEEFLRKNNAMLAFKDYVYNIRDITGSDKNLEASVKKMISYSFKEAIEWLDANMDAEIYEYEYKKQQFEAICNQLLPGSAGNNI